MNWHCLISKQYSIYTGHYKLTHFTTLGSFWHTLHDHANVEESHWEIPDNTTMLVYYVWHTHRQMDSNYNVSSSLKAYCLLQKQKKWPNEHINTWKQYLMHTVHVHVCRNNINIESTVCDFVLICHKEYK